MRLTNVLLRTVMKRKIKAVWKYRGVMASPQVKGHLALVDKGEQIEDYSMGKPKPPPERWKSPVENPERWQHPTTEEQPNWNEEPAYTFHQGTRILEGVNQACILSKSQLFTGLPEGVERLVGRVELPDQDRLVQECIMLSQCWNPTMDKLPRRFDKEKIGWNFSREYGIPQNKAVEILMRSLLLKCQSLAGRFPSLLHQRRIIRRPYLGSHYYFRGDKLINIQGHISWMVFGDQPLPAFGDSDMIDQSVSHQLTEIWPISPTIDIDNNHNYTIRSSTGFSATSKMPHHHPHMLFLPSKYGWHDHQKDAMAIMHCLGYCIAQARHRFGETVTLLPEPISVRCVHMDHNKLGFICFQLNTLNFNNDDGVKNFVWVDSANTMYQKQLPKPWRGAEFKVIKYWDYEPEVFRKLLALYLYGAPELDINSEPVMDTDLQSNEQ